MDRHQHEKGLEADICLRIAVTNPSPRLTLKPSGTSRIPARDPLAGCGLGQAVAECSAWFRIIRREALSPGSSWRLRNSERSFSRKKLRKVRITAMVARRNRSSQLGANEVERISAAIWKVRPATSQRPYRSHTSRL